MSEFVVHSVPGSPFGRSVLIALEEKGAPYRLAALAPGDSKGAAHLARHPFGRVPVLAHDGFVLYETQAILRYLDRVLPEPALTPADVRQAARMDQVMNVSDWYLFQGVCNVILFQRIVGPQFFGTTTDEAAIARAMPQARTVIAELSRLLGEQPFMVGDHLSLADLQAAPQASFLSLTPEWAELTAGHPNLVAWIERLEARPSCDGRRHGYATFSRVINPGYIAAGRFHFSCDVGRRASASAAPDRPPQRPDDRMTKPGRRDGLDASARTP